MVVEITEEGYDELADRMSRADTQINVLQNKMLTRIGKLFVPVKGTGPLAEETPVGKAFSNPPGWKGKRPPTPGRLKKSTWFQTVVLGTAKEPRLEIMQSAKTESGKFYGYWVREGTPPHDIYPKTAKALRFEMDGQIIFAKHVRHPGSKANPYHRRVFQRLLPNVNGIIKEMGGALTAYLSGKGEQVG